MWTKILALGLLAGAVCLVAVGCMDGEGQESGIAGMVSIGPTGAEAQGSEQGERAPYEATIVVKEAASGREVATVESAADGRFRVELPPGEYLLEPATANPLVPPYAEGQRVTVRPGQFTTVEVRYDSGIR